MVLRFSSNYCLCEPCFAIQNIPAKPSVSDINRQYLAAIKIVRNIICRGNPSITDIKSQATIPSEFLEDAIGATDYNEWFLPLLSSDKHNSPKWHKTIKGDETNSYNPALEFLEEIWDKYLPEYSWAKQLIEPEVAINRIVSKPIEQFINQAVDFYMACAGVVIEIDGAQHEESQQAFLDIKRDQELRKSGVISIRIPARAISKRDKSLEKKMEEIREILDHKTSVASAEASKNNYIQLYSEYVKNPEMYETEQVIRRQAFTYIFRTQMAFLLALEKNLLDMTKPVWKIAVSPIENELLNQKHLISLACNDLNKWFEAICKLQKIDFKSKEIEIELCKTREELNRRKNCLRIENDINKRWTDEDEFFPRTLIVRSDYDQTEDHFEVQTLDQISNYKILKDGPDSDQEALDYILRNVFGYHEGFLEGQLQIISSILSGRNTVGILPTGGGKTLCYLFASLLQPAVSIVVSPLKSLMHDQKRNVQELAIAHTNYINSAMTASQRMSTLEHFGNGKYFFVWISPERFQDENFREQLALLTSTRRVAYAVIDEVHCLSEWGHSFRASYLTLVKAIQRLCPGIILAGLTATASQNVLQDIKTSFGQEDTEVVIPKIFSRKNLDFQLSTYNSVESKYQQLCKTLQELDVKHRVLTPQEEKTFSTIIFTINKGSDKMSLWTAKCIHRELRKDLNTDKIAIFHSTTTTNAMSEDVSDDMILQQEEFIDNMKPIIVATKAFGMGINKPNVRYVIQYGIPISLEELYQQAGRAGRDNEPATCLIMYNQDKLTDDHRKKIFAPEASIEEIRAINLLSGDSDLNKQIYLWTMNYLGQLKDIQLAFKIFVDHCRNAKSNVSIPPQNGINTNADKYSIGFINISIIEKWVETNFRQQEIGKSNNSEKYHIEKALYHLSILGIVDDWTINYKAGTMKVHYNRFKIETLENNLLKFIRRYDILFSLNSIEDDAYQINTEEETFLVGYNEKYIQIYRLLKILIHWSYDNIVYARRRALQNIIEACESFTDSQSFKRNIDKYFSINDLSGKLSKIAEDPTDYDLWFNFFEIEKNAEQSQTPEDHLGASTAALADAIPILNRMFENNRYNIGLNYLSGLIHFILDSFDRADGRNRMASALTRMSDVFDDLTPILAKTFDLFHQYKIDEARIESLGHLLIENIPQYAKYQYNQIGDSHSLTHLVRLATKRIIEIGVSINEKL